MCFYNIQLNLEKLLKCAVLVKQKFPYIEAVYNTVYNTCIMYIVHTVQYNLSRKHVKYIIVCMSMISYAYCILYNIHVIGAGY